MCVVHHKGVCMSARTHANRSRQIQSEMEKVACSSPHFCCYCYCRNVLFSPELQSSFLLYLLDWQKANK